MTDDPPANDPTPTTANAEAGAPGSSTPPPAAPADPPADLVAERDRLKDAALRAMADLDNYRKRARRDADEGARKAREDLLRELLPVFDNLERALQYVDTQTDTKAVIKGIEMVLRLFDDTLGRLGGKRVKSLGQPFDPSVHEAIQQVETADYPAGTIAREELAGYVFNDRLLRPAMVVVSKGPPAPKSGE